MSQKKVAPAPAPAAKKAAPTRTTHDALSLMFRRGITRRHNKGKARLVSTGETITKDQYLNVGKHFTLLFDHKVAKRLAPIIALIKAESNPKTGRFYLTNDKLEPSYTPVPFVPKQKAPKVVVPGAPAKVKAPRKKNEVAAVAAPVATAKVAKKSKAKAPAAEVSKKK